MTDRKKAPVRQLADPQWHPVFLNMLPAIRRCAQGAFRFLRPEARMEAVQDVVANAMVAFIRLFDRGKLELAYPTVLARYGIAQHRCGRRVGTKLNIRDVSSPYCRKQKGVEVQRLDRFDDEEKAWKEILVEDKRCGPADLAASRIDFPAWLDTLSRRDRKLALKLSTGESTSRVATAFKVSAGRVSQLRQGLLRSWQLFQGEALADGGA